MNELNIYELFNNIISHSKVMKRFVIAPNYGNALNENNMGELIKDAFKQLKTAEKYPVCLMFPPVEFPDFDKYWSRFNCKLFFLTTPHNGSEGTLKVNPINSLSEHTIPETWKDMNVCAKSFRKFLTEVIENNSDKIREPSSAAVIQRFSSVGNDGVAGVSLTFDIDISDTCQIEDYTPEAVSNFIFNSNNLHKHHVH